MLHSVFSRGVPKHSACTEVFLRADGKCHVAVFCIESCGSVGHVVSFTVTTQISAPHSRPLDAVMTDKVISVFLVLHQVTDLLTPGH